MKFLISDTHFGHKNIIDYENRPFSDVTEMNESLITNWNSVVSSEDIVYHLGDIAFGMTFSQLSEIFSRLNGEIQIIMGNHDFHLKRKRLQQLPNVTFVSPYPVIIEEYFILSHQPLYMPTRGINPYYNIYGHVHGDNRYKDITNNSACVSVERINYTPIKLDTLKGKIAKILVIN